MCESCLTVIGCDNLWGRVGWRWMQRLRTALDVIAGSDADAAKLCPIDLAFVRRLRLVAKAGGADPCRAANRGSTTKPRCGRRGCAQI